MKFFVLYVDQQDPFIHVDASHLFPCILPGFHTVTNKKFDRLIVMLRNKAAVPRFGLEDNTCTACATNHDMATTNTKSTERDRANTSSKNESTT